jgi:hypothetical protein
MRKKRAIVEKPALTEPATEVTTASASANVVPAAGGNSVEDEIRRRAYLKWEAAGRPSGDGLPFWVEAERELA